MLILIMVDNTNEGYESKCLSKVDNSVLQCFSQWKIKIAGIIWQNRMISYDSVSFKHKYVSNIINGGWQFII